MSSFIDTDGVIHDIPGIVIAADQEHTAVYVALDAKVDKAEGDGIMARWEFGRRLLTERIGKQLPKGRLAEVAAAINKSEAEVGHRMRFAERLPTEPEVHNAIRDFRSWYRIVNEFLASTAHLSAEKDEWATPEDLFDALDSEFGFTLDVCASAENAKCRRYFTQAENGLQKSWAGEIAFMNPPYSGVEDWMAKAWAEGRNGATVVCLIPSRTDVGWFWEWARHGEVRFLRGRLHFVDDEGNTGPAPFPSAVVVFGHGFDGRVIWYDGWRETAND